ncbi:hypothetical protein R7D97_20660 [Vibrio sp. Vb5031]|uniref:Lipoprotein n=1 Tax=Vibrio parahaemolyticus TaxID=670 RepID=A0AA47JMQ1_VIBPH|nr:MULTISPECIES: hypothetical protein [Vibrio]OOH98591.1 hypothetical protein BIW16_18910 [Vibrio sp. OULL4]APX09758.1 hypothetical protein BWP24_26465 [Vibrio campbellii]ARR10125.1 hypothetical protein Vc3S01_p20010 [Vibrio campbellii]EGR3502829.1 hypothetical protein [Vibrio parahaemolyticus]MBE4244855.1 hypothetical protein [Vibrio parahaemolyticus]
MKKILLMASTLSVITGCANQTELGEPTVESPSYQYPGISKILSIDYFEVDKGTSVALTEYLDNQDRYCFQWVSSAKKVNGETTNEHSIEANISVHCGGYEIRQVDNKGGDYVSTDIRTVNKYKNREGLFVQNLEM